MEHLSHSKQHSFVLQLLVDFAVELAGSCICNAYGSLYSVDWITGISFQPQFNPKNRLLMFQVKYSGTPNVYDLEKVS